MINLTLKNLKKKDDYLVLEDGNIIVAFSTAENGRSFNRNTKEGLNYLDGIREEFKVDNVAYLKQIHSDKIFIYNGQEAFNNNEGDAIITKKKNIAIGAFTADCVPVIIINKEKGVIGAVHSGWKGTISNITKKTIEKMVEEFHISVEETKVYIGPHIRKCCYEISEELKERFIEETGIRESELFNKRNLSMEKVIEKDLLDIGLKEENIFSLNLCTYCEDEVELYSYRKSDGAYGRLFTFAIIK
ncbi:peptidoglycan editing factor PgeF [uncultured Clostridium sp.]|uniref:peptidoglycan editing factor PgeF n=1 Tax=uncultured Clostridium sp. TaxID=59620 RepID=UPI00260528C1|nr:peptidoglycan editing factor PgeF [uncultured Clostridium sp.]